MNEKIDESGGVKLKNRLVAGGHKQEFMYQKMSSPKVSFISVMLNLFLADLLIAVINKSSTCKVVMISLL